MTHRFRYWRTYPADTRRPSRVVPVCLSIAVLGLVVAVSILFVFVLNLKAARDAEISDRTRAIDQAMCSVLDEFHGTSADLTHARALLHCPIPTS